MGANCATFAARCLLDDPIKETERPMARLLLLNGPNLNLLGTREPAVYGTDSLQSIETHAAAVARELGHELLAFQSDAEHELIERIHRAKTEGVIHRWVLFIYSFSVLLTPSVLARWMRSMSSCSALLWKDTSSCPVSRATTAARCSIALQGVGSVDGWLPACPGDSGSGR